MKRETLSELGLNKEQMDAVFAEHGKTITEYKSRLEAAEKERNDLQVSLDEQQTKLEKQYGDQQKDFAISYTMKNANVHDRDLIMGLLDKTQINIANGELNGLNEQIEGLKETRPYLFKGDEPAEQTPPSPQIVVGGNPSGGVSVESDAFSNITDKYR